LLAKCLDALQSKNVFVVGFLPPFSSESAALLQASAAQSNLWNEARTAIPIIFADRSRTFIDASILKDFAADDSIMIDGVHAAETFHLTLLERFLSNARVAKAFPGLRDTIQAALKSPATNPWYPDYQPFFPKNR